MRKYKKYCKTGFLKKKCTLCRLEIISKVPRSENHYHGSYNPPRLVRAAALKPSQASRRNNFDHGKLVYCHISERRCQEEYISDFEGRCP